MFDPTTGQEIAAISTQDLGTASAWSRGGERLAVGHMDGSIAVWDTKTKSLLASLRGHRRPISALAWNPNGKRLASTAGSEDASVKLWEVETWQVVFAWRGEASKNLYSLAWSPDGKSLAYTSSDAVTRIRDAAPRVFHPTNSPEQKNAWAWFLVTCFDSRQRNPAQAVRLGQEAVAAAPKKGNYWNTLGVARCRAGDWKGAVEALEKSIQLRHGGDGFDFFFLAMAHWQLGKKDEARQWYDKAVRSTKELKNLPSEVEKELHAFQAEAAALLEIQEGKASGKPK